MSVIVAASIVGIAVSMAASALISGSRLSQQAVNLTTASSFAEGVLERVTLQPFESIFTRTVTEDQPDLPGVRCDISVTHRSPRMKEVLVNCSWRERDQVRSVQVATVVAKGGVR